METQSPDHLGVSQPILAQPLQCLSDLKQGHRSPRKTEPEGGARQFSLGCCPWSSADFEVSPSALPQQRWTQEGPWGLSHRAGLGGGGSPTTPAAQLSPEGIAEEEKE